MDDSAKVLEVLKLQRKIDKARDKTNDASGKAWVFAAAFAGALLAVCSTLSDQQQPVMATIFLMGCSLCVAYMVLFAVLGYKAQEECRVLLWKLDSLLDVDTAWGSTKDAPERPIDSSAN